MESIFDVGVGVLILIFAFSQGVFPKPPDFSKLSSFDISYLAGHFRFTLFLITTLAILGLVAFALLSVRVRAFWARVRQGVTILSDRRRYLREVVSWQAAGGSAASPRSGSCWMRSASAARWETCCSCSPSTRSRARSRSLRVARACSRRCLVKVFATSAAGTAAVAAYSVGQQIAIAAFTAAVGLGAVVFIFRFRSFGEVLHAGRASREAERAGMAPQRTIDARTIPRHRLRLHRAGSARATEAPRAPRARV